MLTIARRFNGPPESGNGGYVAGLLAERYAEFFGDVPDYAAVRVTLRKPPPLETEMSIRQLPDSDSLRLTLGNLLIAEAEAVESDPDDASEPIKAVTFEEASKASELYPGFDAHAFPDCFVCGPAHPDGMRIFPGPLDGRPGDVAAPWTVAETGPEFVWAALDCPGGWSTGDLAARPMVLGRMSARIGTLPDVGARCVVLGRHVRTEGRRTLTESALYGPDGDLLARAEAVWVAVAPTR
jgi:hypothetical protein